MNPLVKSADRTLAILDLLTDHRDGLTLTEIQRLLEIPKSSTYTLLVTMATRGFLEQDAETRRFRVGIRLWQAGQSYVAVSDLEQAALPYMEALRDTLNETVQLATLDGTDNVYIAKVDPDQQLRLASRVGIRLPAYATGIGKALLSQLRDEEIGERFAEVRFVQYTPQTITSLPHLLAAVHEVRENGYATDNSEYTPGVFCIAAPFSGHRGGGRAAISVSIPEMRKTPALIATTIDNVRSTAHQLSLRMGYQVGAGGNA
ncbi:IclR family transcriptional regulator [Streptosporangium sp. NPDC000563]|uniref:IclR family transcriptional regulator n=1 Tax=unclassified Streptosporangium TaxID=2632669 RepID=UPI003332A65C